VAGRPRALIPSAQYYSTKIVGLTFLTKLLSFSKAASYGFCGKPSTQNPEGSGLMKHAYPQSLSPKMDWHEALSIAFEYGLPTPFNFDWLIDAAEREAWSGLWW